MRVEQKVKLKTCPPQLIDASLDIGDLDLVQRLSGGKVDLTYGRCVLLLHLLMDVF